MNVYFVHVIWFNNFVTKHLSHIILDIDMGNVFEIKPMFSLKSKNIELYLWHIFKSILIGKSEKSSTNIKNITIYNSPTSFIIFISAVNVGWPINTISLIHIHINAFISFDIVSLLLQNYLIQSILLYRYCIVCCKNISIIKRRRNDHDYDIVIYLRL